MCAHTQIIIQKNYLILKIQQIISLKEKIRLRFLPINYKLYLLIIIKFIQLNHFFTHKTL